MDYVKLIVRLGLLVIVLVLVGCTGPLLTASLEDEAPVEEDSGSEPDLRDHAPVSESGEEEYSGAEIVLRVAADASAEAMAEALNARLIDELMIGETRYVKYRLAAGEDRGTALSRAEALPGAYLAYEEVIWDHYSVTPDDPYYAGYQYAPQITGLETAWATSGLSNEVVIAVIDSGVDTQHTDFRTGQFIEGYDAIQNEAYLVTDDRDEDGHGTHVAGIAAASGNNQEGIAGVAWDAYIMPIKSLGTSGGTSLDVAEGIDFTTDAARADPSRRYVINMSLGGKSASPAVADAIARAVQNNVVVVVAMGNDGMDTINYPAGYPGVITVGSTNSRDELSDFSTKGRHIALTAPGENIISLDAFSTTGYVAFDGTSMAAPFVSGVAALLLAKDNSLSPAEVNEILTETATDLGDSGWDRSFGYGRVNAGAALSATANGSFGAIEVSVTNDGTAVDGAEVQLLSSDGTTVLHTTLTGSSGTALFPMLSTSESFDILTGYYGSTQTADNVAPGTPPTAVNASFNVSLTITVAGYYIEYAGGYNDVDTRLTLYDASQNQLSQASDDQAPQYAPFNAPYAELEFSVTPPGLRYIRVDVEPTPAAGYAAPGYATLYANQGTDSDGYSIAVSAGNLPSDPGGDFASATILRLDSFYPFYLEAGEEEFFVMSF
jgi:subtilisin family serine protease